MNTPLHPHYQCVYMHYDELVECGAVRAILIYCVISRDAKNACFQG